MTIYTRVCRFTRSRVALHCMYVFGKRYELCRKSTLVKRLTLGWCQLDSAWLSILINISLCSFHTVCALYSFSLCNFFLNLFRLFILVFFSSVLICFGVCNSNNSDHAIFSPLPLSNAFVCSVQMICTWKWHPLCMEYALYNMQFIFDEIFARQTLTALSDDGEKRKWLDCERVL